MIPSPSLIDHFCKIPGAFAVSEAIAMYIAITQELPKAPGWGAAINGPVCELGAHCGKASSILTQATYRTLHPGTTVEVHLVDPLFDRTEENYRETCQKTVDNIPWAHCQREDFNEWVIKNSLSDCPTESVHITLLGTLSWKYLVGQPHLYCALVDSDDHNDELVLRECKLLETSILPGGLVFFHDFGNYGGPVKGHEYLLSTGRFENVELLWGTACTMSAEGNWESRNDSWHAKQSGDNARYLGCARRIIR